MQKIPFETIQASINKTDYDFPTLICDYQLRSPEMIVKYEVLKLEIKKNGKTNEQVIREQVFKNGEIFGSEKAKITYDLIEIRFHYILWVNSNDQETIRKAIEFEKQGLAGETYEFFQNESKNKSVPGITHFHFLVK